MKKKVDKKWKDYISWLNKEKKIENKRKSWYKKNYGQAIIDRLTS